MFCVLPNTNTCSSCLHTSKTLIFAEMLNKYIRIRCSDACDSLEVVQELKGFMIDLGFINLMAQSKKEFNGFTNK